jgi:DNA invertase Pin-like site-specific DNA recombinase
MSSLRVAIYVRVSTQDQSCELQRRELEEFALSRSWTIYSVFEDKATGTNGNRPMLKAMLSDARARKFDVLLCWKLDRLFRSLKDLVVVLQDLKELGVDFVSLRDNLDLTTSAGRLMLHMIGAFAEFEASLIRERVCAGIRNARAKGKRLGRPKVRDDAQIATLRSRGMSMREIAKQLRTSLGSVQRGIKNSSAI